MLKLDAFQMQALMDTISAIKEAARAVKHMADSSVAVNEKLLEIAEKSEAEIEAS